MKFIQILQDTVEAGALVEWTPLQPARGTWIIDERPTSHNHEQHLRAALAHQHVTGAEGGRESWLGLAIEFEEPLSVPAIRATLTAWINRHEVLRSHVVVRTEGLVRVTVPPGSIALKMGRIGWYSQPQLLIEQLAGAFDRATAPTRWPAYLFATVARERSFTLLFAADHSLLDGYSLVMAQHELVALYRAYRRRATDPDDPAPAALPEVGSYIDFSAAERRAADEVDTTHPALALWSDFLGPDNRLPTFGAVPPRPGGHGRDDTRLHAPDRHDSGRPQPQAALSIDIADDSHADLFTAACSAAGGSLQVGVLAALALSYHRVVGADEFRCILPRHTRHDAQWLAALGWFVTLAPFRIDVSDDPAFAAAVSRSAAEMRRTREASSLPFLRVAELLGVTDAPRFVVSFMDTRSAPGAVEADAGRATVLRSHSYAHDEVYLWINRTPSGLRCSARYPADTPLTGTVLRYISDFTMLITALGDRSAFRPGSALQ